MNYHEYIILGAGPAGLQMGYFMEQAGHDYLMIEGNSCAASFFTQYPRHGTLISLNKCHNWFEEKEFNLRHDWNSLLTDDFSHMFPNYSQELYPKNSDLVRYANDFATKFALKIQYNTRISHIAREADENKQFVLTDAQGTEYRCKKLLLATGPVKPIIPKVEGIELAEGYEDHDAMHPERYDNKRVVVLGRGNSAFEVADHLAGHAAIIFVMIGNRLIRHAWNSHFVGDLRSYNNTILDMFQLKALHGVTGTTLTKIEKQENGALRVYYTEELPHWNTPGTAHGWFEVDHVIRSVGFNYVDQDLFAADIVPAADKMQKYPVLTTMWESTVPDMYFMGTNMAARDKKSASGFIHGFRYNVRTLFHLLEAKYHGKALPSDQFSLKDEMDLKKLGSHLVTRLSTTSALYQLFGTLCDVLVLEEGQATLLYELPIAYVLTQPEFANKKIIIFSLELGFEHFENGFEDSLNFVRRNDPERPGSAAFLHPVFRYYENGEFVKGANTRSSVVVRFDEPADLLDGDLANEKPRNVLLNFINSLVKVTDMVYSEEHFSSDAERGGFTPWAKDDPRIQNHGLQRCKLMVDDPQVMPVKLMYDMPMMEVPEELEDM
jgi:thioredoxin reductase